MRAVSSRVALIASRVVAVLAGLLWGFFVAFNAVFSDVFGLKDMLAAIVYVLVAYFGLGLMFGVLGPRTSWRWTWWLAPPGVVLAVVMIGDSPGRIVYVVGVAASVVVATLAGSWLGALARVRAARTAPPSDPNTPSGPTVED